MPDATSHAVERKPKAVLFVPGFSTLNKGEALERQLLKGVQAARGHDIVSESSASCSGLTGSRVTFQDGSVDFFELYWLDLAQHLTKRRR